MNQSMAYRSPASGGNGASRGEAIHELRRDIGPLGVRVVDDEQHCASRRQSGRWDRRQLVVTDDYGSRDDFIAVDRRNDFAVRAVGQRLDKRDRRIPWRRVENGEFVTHVNLAVAAFDGDRVGVQSRDDQGV
ncbi:hypothetical protein [Antrihabitans stalactiti]|uniref:hypothetical protein n=1 Tax=Antrihabitans stalactiti TaxID=2584121 RepID=UPI00146C2AA3|nr:hypothetical protein [Antrihabitans stalactiti]